MRVRTLQLLEGEVLRACATPTDLYGLETVAQTKQRKQKLQICDNNWVWVITGAKREDRRRMDDPKEETGM